MSKIPAFFILLCLMVLSVSGCGGTDSKSTEPVSTDEPQAQSITTDGIWIKDSLGRVLILRGVNVDGLCKVPAKPDGATHLKEGFFDWEDVSFVGRPFPLEEADEHFSRLAEWGQTFVRFLITWEAIEHAGPGQYDEEYLDYVRAIVQKAGEHGLSVFIDPHQDVWSRWTGGDGAPAWTLEKVGFDITKLDTAGAAVTHQIHGDPWPDMLWPTNHTKLGAATMFTLFFAGDEFAPNTKIDGVPVQQYLQSHYINAVKKVAEHVADLPNVVGYDSMNEPGSGFVGIPDMDDWGSMLYNGLMPTPAQAIMGSSYPQEVAVFPIPPQIGQIGTAVMNPEGISVWKEGYEDIWKTNGVWTDEGGEPRILRPDHFAFTGDQATDFERDFIKPFLLRYIEEIRSVDPDAIIFVETRNELNLSLPEGTQCIIPWGPDDPDNIVYTPHWYDSLTYVNKTYNPEITMRIHPTIQAIQGRENVQAFIEEQLGEIKYRATMMGGIPTLIGEYGVPMDLNDGESFVTGDFELQTLAMDSYLDGMDAHLLNCTQWVYSSASTNERGTQWNGEDFSIFCRDQQTNPLDMNSGGRTLEAIVRPYARATAGEPLEMSFDMETGIFDFEFLSDPAIDAPTEIFVPGYQYPSGYTVELSAGSYEKDEESQLLRVSHPEGESLNITLRLAPAD